MIPTPVRFSIWKTGRGSCLAVPWKDVYIAAEGEGTDAQAIGSLVRGLEFNDPPRRLACGCIDRDSYLVG